MTMHEVFGPHSDTDSEYISHLHHPKDSLPGLKVAWIGDGNNMLHSMLVTFPKLGIHFSAATPKNYQPDADVVEIAKKEAKNSGSELSFTTAPKEAVKDADIIVTDTW